MRPLFLGIALVALTASSAGASEALDAFLEQLKCNAAPDATEALLGMLEDGTIDADSREGVRSTYCWKLTEPVDIQGVSFIRLCASNDDPELIAAHPEIYYRGPGLAPGSSISMNSTDPGGFAKIAGFGSGNLRVTPAYLHEGEMSITCYARDFEPKS